MAANEMEGEPEGLASLSKSSVEDAVTTDEHQVTHREIEVLLSEMETRLRRAVLKVVRPSLDQVADMEKRLVTVMRKVDKHDAFLNHSETLELEVRRLEGMMDVFRDELTKSDQHTRGFESKASAELEEISRRTFQCEQRLDNLEGQQSKTGRDFGRVWNETQRLQHQHEESSKNLWKGLDGSLKKTDQAREEVVARIAEVQKLHDDLVEDVFGDGKGLIQVRLDVKRLDVAVEPIERLEVRIEETMDKVNSIEDSVSHCNNTCESTTEAFVEVKESVDTRLTDYDDSNKNIMNKLTAYHASVLRSVRVEFSEEIQESKRLREQISSFESETNTICQQLSESLQQEVARVNSIHKELVRDIAEVEVRRKRDRIHLDRDLQRVEGDSQTAQDISESAYSAVEYVSKVLALVLESEKMSSALHIQDFADRCCECWLGMPSDAKRKPASPHTALSLEKLQPNFESFGRDFAAEDMISLVPLDSRKGLAKLEYLPGRICYEGKQLDRRLFLLHHHRMLTRATQAAKAFERRSIQRHVPHPNPKRVLQAQQPGHASAEHLDLSQITLQPGAKGGQGGSEVPGPPKSGGYCEAVEHPKSAQSAMNSSAGFAQRPGSSHQPQAVGSKGSMSGPLGQTSPPSAAVPSDSHPSLTLPNIHPSSVDVAHHNSQGEATVTLDSLRFSPGQAKTRPVDAALQSGAFTAR